MEAFKKTTFILLVLFITACQTTQNESIIQWDWSFTHQDKDIQHITQKYNSYLQEINVATTVLVNHNNKQTLSSSTNNASSENKVFNIGSATKKMTAILILQEEEKGNLSLSDSIGKYLDPIANVDGQLTIETLLRHRSGLGELVGREAESMFFNQSDSIYSSNFLDKIPPNDSGKIGQHDYCNTNYILLGHLLEKVTDQNYFDLLQKRIFDSCDMKNSYPYVSKSIKNLAHPTHNGVDVYENIDYRFFANYAFSAGSVASTLEDMSKFYNHLFSENTLINQASLQKLTDFDDADYGLGMMKITIDSVDYIGHGGNNIGYSFREYYNPKTKGLVLIFSTSMNIPYAKILRRELLSYTNNKLNRVEFNPHTSTEFEASIGTYFFEEMGINLSIIKENDHLFLDVQGSKLILANYKDNILSTAIYGIELEVNSTNDNEITFTQNGMQATIKRIVQ